MHLQLRGASFIDLGSHDAAVELLEKRNASYSARPKFARYELSGSMGWKNILPLVSSGERFRRQRQALQTYLTLKSSLLKCGDVQTPARAVRRLARRMIDKQPEDEEHVCYLNQFVLLVYSDVVPDKEELQGAGATVFIGDKLCLRPWLLLPHTAPYATRSVLPTIPLRLRSTELSFALVLRRGLDIGQWPAQDCLLPQEIATGRCKQERRDMHTAQGSSTSPHWIHAAAASPSPKNTGTRNPSSL
uniref:Cytochrome P450 n=1 Tax=Mycena chlorophos TaxID=658473 RepID=A0ABQ0LSX7_MYCCL|nr:cytochrome P450 [Mycena chlorophos]